MIAQLEFKISKIGALQKVVEGLSLCCSCKTSTNVAKYISNVLEYFLFKCWSISFHKTFFNLSDQTGFVSIN